MRFLMAYEPRYGGVTATNRHWRGDNNLGAAGNEQRKQRMNLRAAIFFAPAVYR